VLGALGVGYFGYKLGQRSVLKAIAEDEAKRKATT